MPFAYKRKGGRQDLLKTGTPSGAMTTADTLGKRIARARILAGAERGKPFTQTELARLVGVTPPTVSQWESDASEPPLATIVKIAATLGVEPGRLAFGDVPTGAPTSGQLTEGEIAAAIARSTAERAARGLPSIAEEEAEKEQARQAAREAARRAAAAPPQPKRRRGGR